ncbi:unnamed protein product [Sympodiomycopsis kandeliae]
MAPSKTGKKPPAHSDFSKSKSSLKTKQKAAPSNATNTSFKSRSIVLPNQGTITKIEERKQTQLTDGKGRGVEELVTIVRGVGQGGSKAEALDSLTLLCDRVPDRVTLGLGLLPIVLPLITSNSAQIRNSLYKFMVHLLKTTPRDALAPYTTTMTLWITSGMNHIWKEVREDAAKLGQVVIEVLGPELVRGWTWTSSETNGYRFYTTLLTALGVQTSSGSANPQSQTSSGSANTQSDLSSSPISKLRLLSCLVKLIRFQAGDAQDDTEDDEEAEQGASTAEQTIPMWIFKSCLENPSDWENFLLPSQSSTATLPEHRPLPFRASLSLVEEQYSNAHVFADVAGSAGLSFSDEDLYSSICKDPSSSSVHSGVNPYLQLYYSLHPLLLHTWLDHAPSVLGPDATSAQEPSLGLRLLDIVIRLARTLYRAALRSINGVAANISLRGADKEALKELSTLLDHSSVYFPFTSGSSNAVSLIVKRLSAGWCELVGIQRMLTGPEDLDKVRKKKSKQPTQGWAQKSRAKEDKEGGHLSSVESYLIQLFQPSPTQEISDSPRLTPGEYLSLLPVVWHLLSSDTSPSSSHLLHVFISHWNGLKPVWSAMKSQGLHFLVSICTLSQYQHSLSPAVKKILCRPSSPIHSTLSSEFVLKGIGRYIYEVGLFLHTNKSSSKSRALVANLEMVWRYVHTSLQYCILTENVSKELLRTLTPFFYIHNKGCVGPAKRILAGEEGETVRQVVRAVREVVKRDYHADQEGERFLQAVQLAMQ